MGFVIEALFVHKLIMKSKIVQRPARMPEQSDSPVHETVELR